MLHIKSIEEIEEYIMQYNPYAANRVVHHIFDLVNNLSVTPNMGVAGREPNTRELFSSQYPYLIAYQVNSDSVDILQVLHLKTPIPA
ncbi:MAG: type II toxin-antitoxin system RelE/ParE family toxin [Magnetococcales bacterium]|nr:type II toxin-antitoxin system RelE/ParE family toxin [Magnetococcales bacterium]